MLEIIGVHNSARQEGEDMRVYGEHLLVAVWWTYHIVLRHYPSQHISAVENIIERCCCFHGLTLEFKVWMHLFLICMVTTKTPENDTDEHWWMNTLFEWARGWGL